MFIYLSFGGILAVHLIKQLRSKKKGRKAEDFDLLDVANFRQSIVKKFERKDLFWLLFMIFCFVLHQAIDIEDLGVGFRIFHIAILIAFILFFILPELYRVLLLNK